MCKNPAKICEKSKKLGDLSFQRRGFGGETIEIWQDGEYFEENEQEISETQKQREVLEKKWNEYFQRPGLKTAFDMLIGLCK